MELHRFSPIQDEAQMMKAIKHIHFACHTLCMQSMGRYLPVAGNVGVFCHDDDEYAFLTKLREKFTDSSNSVYGKYFRLHKPIVIPAKGDIPKTTYSYLYIRKPDPNKNQVGDIDFYLEPEKYAELKQSLLEGKMITGARVLPNRPDLDLIELYSQDIDAFGYIGNKKWQ
ncbi:MAG TPA: hypothetical protein DCX25_02570 [Candidatus Pacebacteria bacterium]|nr:hypothetical protein [Candidatus Paceibacterota bacterium]HCR11101.1 hypothetical protein [Candidatus Paceibacterota bacterium]HCR93234.1 hypothetical protein [Candidatus Paceibacterota bacterium]